MNAGSIPQEWSAMGGGRIPQDWLEGALQNAGGWGLIEVARWFSTALNVYRANVEPDGSVWIQRERARKWNDPVDGGYLSQAAIDATIERIDAGV